MPVLCIVLTMTKTGGKRKYVLPIKAVVALYRSHLLVATAVEACFLRAW